MGCVSLSNNYSGYISIKIECSKLISKNSQISHMKIRPFRKKELNVDG
jgi:hypothetical protein